MEQLENKLYQTLSRWAKLKEGEMKSILARNKMGRSNIYKQIKLKILRKNGSFEVTTQLPMYAIYVDKGRRPGKQPPLNIIKAWCKRKVISQGAAFPIARKIGKKGLPATNFMDPLRQLKELINELKNKTIEASIQEIRENIKNR